LKKLALAAASRAGVHGTPVRGRRQALRVARAAGSRPEIHGRSGRALDKLGGASWEKAKTRVKKAMRDMAEELLKLYAARKAVAGFAFSPDSHWQQEFADAFEYELTPDQTSAIADITRTGSRDAMDACSAVTSGTARRSRDAGRVQGRDGRQAGRVSGADDRPCVSALKTIQERFAGFPVSVDMVSRSGTRRSRAPR
jgi:transcription-repair coupling factor (superfamily II helicase)